MISERVKENKGLRTSEVRDVLTNKQTFDYDHRKMQKIHLYLTYKNTT